MARKPNIASSSQHLPHSSFSKKNRHTSASFSYLNHPAYKFTAAKYATTLIFFVLFRKLIRKISF